MTRAQRIISIAEGYIGNKEIKGNQGFVNKAFEKKMRLAGFYLGAPWCAFTTKSIYMEAYSDNKMLYAAVVKCCSGGALLTLSNHEKDGTFTVGEEPRPGAIIIWRMGTGKSGHAGIVVSVNRETNTMVTIEGNTNAHGSREGDQVAKKLRTITRDFQKSGLNVAGYVYPFEI